MGSAEMHHANPRLGRQMPGCERRTEWVLLRPQMPDDQHLEDIGLGRVTHGPSSRRLVDDPQLGVESLRKNARNLVVQTDEPVRDVEAAQGRLRLRREKVIEVGAGQHHDDGPVRIGRSEFRHGFGATPCVQRDQRIRVAARRWIDEGLVPRDPRNPAHRVAVARLPVRRVAAMGVAMAIRMSDRSARGGIAMGTNRTATGADLMSALHDARARTLELVDGLDGDALMGSASPS